MATAPGKTHSARKRLVVLTGAGISVDSGLKPFRGQEGLWENHRIEDVATPHAWKRQPDVVNAFYNERRAAAANAQPNEAHRLLASIESECEVQIITQNVDDLHERGGSSLVLHLHGMLRMARSTGPVPYQVDLGGAPITPEMRSPEGHPLRPDIVWFGEAVPAMDEAVAMVRDADILLVIGTSLNVYPAAGLLFEAPPSCPVYYIDPDPNLDAIPKGVKVIATDAVTGLQLFIETHLPYVNRA